METPTLYRPDEVWPLLKISRATFYRMVQQRKVHTVHVGAQLRVTPAEVERLLREGTVAPEPMRLVPPSHTTSRPRKKSPSRRG